MMRSGGRLIFALGACVAVMMPAVSGGAVAAEKSSISFLGVKIKPQPGTYIVLRDVRIRARPKTKSKKIGVFKAGKRIQVVGKAAISWVAVREGDKDVGFVYDRVLLPLIDGTLERELTGKAADETKGGAACDYGITFEGKSAVEGQVFEIADYDVLWNCRLGARKVKFRTPMFITEAPYQMGSKRIFQINIDILDLDGGYEDVFSTTILFNLDKARIVFDGVSIKKYGRIPKIKEAKAASVSQALKASVEMAIQAWNKATWKDLIKNIPKYPEPISAKKKSAKPGK